MRPRTSQEKFWSEDFGTEYTHRNSINANQRTDFFAHILGKTLGVHSICEFGANQGHNLEAIHQLSPNYQLSGVELNASACAMMREKSYIETIHCALQDFNPLTTYDLILTCGVLIHLNPDDLPMIYQKMYDCTNRYLLINEYFNPSPVALDYRGHTGKLFKRDFASDLIDTVGDDKVRVIDYGFLWKRLAPSWDNTTWFLIEKR